MNKHFKLLLAVIVTTLIPLWGLAQQPVQTKLTEINIHNVQTIEERVFLIHSIQESEFFSYRLSDEEGKIDIYVSDVYTCKESNANDDFDDFLEQLEVEWMSYNNLDKNERGRLFVEWRYQMDDPVFLMINEDFHRQLRDNNTCEGADPFCTDNGLYQFPAGTNAGNLGSSQTVPYYCSGFVRPNGQGSTNCLYTTPNPAFYYMQIDQPGNLNIYMYSTPSHDIDFDCWGPFTSMETACSQLACSNMVDCSYSASATENCHINNAQTGQYYILLITNYSNQSCNISFSNIGTGTTNCGILPPMVGNNGPYCVGDVINLNAHGQTGASYSWSGPGNFSSTQQNPTRPNCTMAMAGTYTCTITVGNQTNSATTEVVIYPQPTANFNFTSVCQGTPTQFTSTSTTNPSGQQIQNYQWNFGDGQTGNGQNVTHTYAQPGNYNVTLTTSCGDGHCTSDKTQTVPVYANPTASATATPSTVIYGGVATLTASAGTQGSFNFHWEPANMVVNANAQTTQTVQLQATQTYTVTVTNPQGGCSSTAQVTVSMEGSNMTALASADDAELCEGESTTLHAQPSGGTGNYTYSWTPANTLNNAHSQNPVATPPVGTTTYTCTVSDGITGQDVSVTIVVHPNRETNIYQTICANETYNFFGENLNSPGTYNQTIETQYGCDSTIHLHLENWDIYETPITRHVCQGDTYDFFGEQLSASGTYYHRLESVHGCDSIIKLSLIQDPTYEFHIPESTCEGGPGYYYNGDYLQPSPYEYVYNFETVMGCDSIIFLSIEETEYNSKTYNVSLCATEYTWPSNGITYYETNTYYDTLSYAGSCDSTLVLNLELKPSFNDDITKTSCDSYLWQDFTYNVDTTFYQSTIYPHRYINSYGCESEVTLHLTINDSVPYTQSPDDLEHVYYTEVTRCDSARWDGVWYYDSAPTNRPYKRMYQTYLGCDSIVYFPLKLDYTPSPYEIKPEDYNNSAPHWVVTATEFQINSYAFNISEKDHPSTCAWDHTDWHFQKKLDDDWVEDPNVQWVLEKTKDTVSFSSCTMYVLNYIPDTIWLAATIYNRCAPEGVTQRYWFVCSFYGIEETESSLANFEVVPNPNNGQMQLNFEYLTGKVNIKVYDMKGSLIDNFETYNGNGPCSHIYNMKNKAEGIYFFVATGKEGTVAKKVVIQK